MIKKVLLFIFVLVSSVAFSQEINIGPIKNNIEIGPLSGNRDLAFGVKNILEEVLQEKGYELTPEAKRLIEVNLLYFDVKSTNMQIAVYANNMEVTEIIAQGKLVEEGKELKSVVVKGQAKSVSTSTLVIDTGGKFSQTNVSSALKKVCEQIIDKLKI
jgi:uncharacterized lipoprotein YajG